MYEDCSLPSQSHPELIYGRLMSKSPPTNCTLVSLPIVLPAAGLELPGVKALRPDPSYGLRVMQPFLTILLPALECPW